MKTNEQVDAIMARIPVAWRDRWCGGENGPCACLGCVYTGAKRVVAEQGIGARYWGDPERLSESGLKLAYPHEYAEYMLTREEWTDWLARQQG